MLRVEPRSRGSVNQWSQIGITLMRNRIWIPDPRVTVKVDPDPHQSEKSDQDPHQSGITITNLLTSSYRRKCHSDNIRHTHRP
jgi:hypothetical protein